MSSQMRPPGGRSTGRPSPPPPRGGTSAPTASARRKGEHRRRGESRDGVPQAAAWNESREAAARHPPPPPPAPPPARRPQGPRPPPPEAEGTDPPAREGSRSVTRPDAPAAGSNGGREEQVGPRLRTGTPRRSCPEKPGGREPEWYGWPRPPWTARRQGTPALLPTQGRRPRNPLTTDR